MDFEELIFETCSSDASEICESSIHSKSYCPQRFSTIWYDQLQLVYHPIPDINQSILLQSIKNGGTDLAK